MSETTEIPNDYKVQHLFLLVGENPLPNYVAAKLLFDEKGERVLYLIHTDGTSEAAERLQEILTDIEVQLVSIYDNESDAHEITKAISEELDNIEEGKIGLNYTGGTKAMSVHSYRALFYQEQDNGYMKRSNVVFSYLDARSLEMCFDKEHGERDPYKVTPEMLQVDLNTILELHGWQKLTDRATTYTPKLDKAAEAFAKFYQHLDDARKWNELYKDYIEKKSLNVDDLNSYPRIKDAFKQLGITENTSALKYGDLEPSDKWLNGEWLEHFVFLKVKEISQTRNIHDSAISIPIKEANSKGNHKFEIDVAFMRGYQLFAISCTARVRPPTKKSRKKDINDYKQKLFEAYIRARQLGGDEARVALVCPADSEGVKKLETEIINLFDPETKSSEKDHRLKVFGREDWMDLSAKIEQWIKDVERKAR